MKLGVFTCLLQNLPLEEALKYFKSLGIEMIELGCGGSPVFPNNTNICCLFHVMPVSPLTYTDTLYLVYTNDKYVIKIHLLNC